MARHRGRLVRRLDLKPLAFRLVDRLVGASPARRHRAGFYPDPGWPAERVVLAHASRHRFALTRPRYAEALRAVSQANVDVFDPGSWFTDPDEALRLCAFLDDVVVPGHTLTPVDRRTGLRLYHGSGTRARWGFAHPAPTALRARPIDGPCLAIPPFRHYGHLLTDVLMPAFFALERGLVPPGETLHVVTARAPDALVRGFIDGLAASGRAVRHVEIGPFEHVAASRYLHAQSCCPNLERLFSTPEAIGLARESYRAAYRGRPRAAPARRLYVSRGGARLRRVEGEAELVAGLRRLGFEVFEPAWANHHDQVELFAAADVVVGVHGAALANMLWARPDALLIELMSANGRKSTGLHWAAEAGADYRPLFGSPEGPKQSFSIDPAATLREIEAILAEREGRA